MDVPLLHWEQIRGCSFLPHHRMTLGHPQSEFWELYANPQELFGCEGVSVSLLVSSSLLALMTAFSEWILLSHSFYVI